MKMRTGIVGLALIAPLSVAWGAGPNPESMTKVPCSDLHFSQEFLQKYPRAPDACIEGRQDKSGAKYGKFHAVIYLNSPDRTTVNVVDAKGDKKETFSFKGKPGATITMNGKKTRLQDLKVGDDLYFWVPESRLSAGPEPGPNAQWTVLPPLDTQK